LNEKSVMPYSRPDPLLGAAYKLLIFDFDGTLADTFGFFVRHFNHTARKFGFKPILDNEIESFRRLDPDSLRGRLESAFWTIPFVARHMQKLMAGEIGKIRTFRGVPQALKKLHRRGCLLTLVSSNSEENVRRVLGPGTTALFKRLEFGAALFGKARLLRRVLRWSRVNASDAVYIADELRDVEAARKAGISFGAVSWGYCPLDTLKTHNPEVVFKKVSDLVPKRRSN
jgi:phosphoglycolate phosphatase